MRKLLCCILATIMCVFGLTSCSNAQQSGGESNSTTDQQGNASIEFVTPELELEIGESVQAEVTTSRKNAPVFWSIRDENIASVNNKGVITALASGETVCYAQFSGETAMCLVIVKEQSAVPELSIVVPYDKNQVFLYPEKTLNLNAMVKLGDELVSDATLEYTVADAQIATVENGVVTAKGVGDTTVTITATSNGQTATTVVSVQVINTVKAVKEVTISGQKTTFAIGDKFFFGGKVDVVYTDNTKESDIDYYTVDISNYNTAKVGSYEIVVNVGDAQATYSVKVEKRQTLKLLMIGNSFSQDTVNWLPQIASSLGFQSQDIVIGNLVIGGCTLATHYANSQSNAAEYEFTYYQNGVWVNGSNGPKQTMEYGIRFTNWDFISLQQQSGNSGNPDSYNSDLTGLVKYVQSRATNTNMKLVWNMTWAYPSSSNWFGGLYSNSQANMYNAIVSTVQAKIVPNEEFRLISPAGTAIQNGRTSYIGDDYTGDDVNKLNEWNRDGAHLSVYEGRFMSSLTMFCTLTGYTPDEITYNPTNVDAKEAAVIRESVRNALANPFAVTNSQYTE
ncbi:MAG: DUF4886 domain-containing protein [Clostridiales bacterium]|nr:DUF4886 domain-containing protein [Clostridiales bacterium]